MLKFQILGIQLLNSLRDSKHENEFPDGNCPSSTSFRLSFDGFGN